MIEGDCYQKMYRREYLKFDPHPSTNFEKSLPLCGCCRGIQNFLLRTRLKGFKDYIGAAFCRRLSCHDIDAVTNLMPEGIRKGIAGVSFRAFVVKFLKIGAAMRAPVSNCPISRRCIKSHINTHDNIWCESHKPRIAIRIGRACFARQRTIQFE